MKSAQSSKVQAHGESCVSQHDAAESSEVATFINMVQLDGWMA